MNFKKHFFHHSDSRMIKNISFSCLTSWWPHATFLTSPTPDTNPQCGRFMSHMWPGLPHMQEESGHWLKINSRQVGRWSFTHLYMLAYQMRWRRRGFFFLQRGCKQYIWNIWNAPNKLDWKTVHVLRFLTRPRPT